MYLGFHVKLIYFQNASKACCREQIKYAAAGSTAEEVFTAIRTVAAFGLEKKEIAR